MCECPLSDTPFFCERHQVAKTPHHQHLCMYNEKYFQAWEEGIGPGQFKKIKRKVIRMAAIPKEDWPKWAKLIARYRKPGHEGVGDTFEYIADKVGGRQIKAWSKRLGIPCGCGGRKRKFNTQYPYTD